MYHITFKTNLKTKVSRIKDFLSPENTQKSGSTLSISSTQRPLTPPTATFRKSALASWRESSTSWTEIWSVAHFLPADLPENYLLSVKKLPEIDNFWQCS